MIFIRLIIGAIGAAVFGFIGAVAGGFIGAAWECAGASPEEDWCALTGGVLGALIGMVVLAPIGLYIGYRISRWGK